MSTQAVRNAAQTFELPPPTLCARLLETVKKVIQTIIYYLVQFANLLTCNLIPCLSTYAAKLRAHQSAYERDHRIRHGTEEIAQRLARELDAAQVQMNNEADKAFRFALPFNLQEENLQRFGAWEAGCHQVRGDRPYQEDRFAARGIHYDHPNHFFSYFGVFDGHAGSDAADYARTHFERILNQKLDSSSQLSDERIWNALKMTCVELNEEFRLAHPNNPSGTTAAIAIVIGNDLWCVNVGDSRIILSENGRAVQLTEDAKPTDPRYQRGIEHRGGNVLFGRINLKLAVGRAIGDETVGRGICARPKITKLSLNSLPEGGHLILGTDGIWDVASTRQVAAVVYAHRNESADKLAEAIVSSTLRAGSTDNQTALVVKIPAPARNPY